MAAATWGPTASKHSLCGTSVTKFASFWGCLRREVVAASVREHLDLLFLKVQRHPPLSLRFGLAAPALLANSSPIWMSTRTHASMTSSAATVAAAVSAFLPAEAAWYQVSTMTFSASLLLRRLLHPSRLSSRAPAPAPLPAAIQEAGTLLLCHLPENPQLHIALLRHPFLKRTRT